MARLAGGRRRRTTVALGPGDAVLFRGDVCHRGLGAAADNHRVHAHCWAAGYDPGVPHIHACG